MEGLKLLALLGAVVFCCAFGTACNYIPAQPASLQEAEQMSPKQLFEACGSTDPYKCEIVERNIEGGI